MSTREQTDVSVVITCYNHAPFLGEAVGSALAQRGPGVEVVVVDDGSTDGSAAVAEGFEGVRVIRQRNQGVAAARNAGLRASGGRYVVFLDGDDRLLPGALGAGALALGGHPAAAFAYGRYRAIAHDGSPAPTPPQPRVEGDHYEALLRRNHIPLPGMVIYRRDVFDAAPAWDGAADHAGDWELYLRLARRFPVVCHHAPVVEYRLHPANTSHDYALMLKCSMAVLRAQRPHVRGERRLRDAYRDGVETIRASYGEMLFERARARMRAGEWRPAAADARALLRHYPQGVFRHARRKAALLGGGAAGVKNA
ncbi:MAG TPA: glycosyltransferase [Pyrinomonadaceae bacterium]|jgi:glycosyltransferase involved in cell wall biosynthesis